MALKASVIGAVIGGLVEAVAALGNYISKILEAKKEQKEFNKVMALSLAQMDAMSDAQKDSAIELLKKQAAKLKEERAYIERGLANQKKMTNWTSLAPMPGQLKAEEKILELTAQIDSIETRIRALKKQGIFADKEKEINIPLIKYVS